MIMVAVHWGCMHHGDLSHPKRSCRNPKREPITYLGAKKQHPARKATVVAVLIIPCDE
jgi:hypothetical protein